MEIPGVAAEAFGPHLKAEARRVWEIYQAGILREISFRQDQNTAVLMLECATVDEAHAVLGSLPLVQAGLIHFDVIPLAPYPGLARLFAPEGSP
jgi:muconolactone delta-isomerase